MGERQSFTPALNALGNHFLGDKQDETSATQRINLLAHGEQPVISLVSLCHNFIRLVNNIRELFNADIWRHLRLMQQVLTDYRINQNNILGSSQRLCNRIHGQLLAISSSLHDGMMHDETWSFIELGRHVERSQITCRILHAFSSNSDASSTETTQTNYATYDSQDLILALSITDSDLIWRTRHGDRIDQQQLHQFLIHHHQHPRSLQFIYDALERRLNQLLPEQVFQSHQPLIMMIEQIRALTWDKRFTEAEDALQDLANAIDVTWFSHAVLSHKVTSYDGLTGLRPTAPVAPDSDLSSPNLTQSQNQSQNQNQNQNQFSQPTPPLPPSDLP